MLPAPGPAVAAAVEGAGGPPEAGRGGRALDGATSGRAALATVVTSTSTREQNQNQYQYQYQCGYRYRCGYLSRVRGDKPGIWAGRM